jgi:epoxyqueuosine reductase
VTYFSTELSNKIKSWGQELGFAAIGITDTNLTSHTAYFNSWLKQNWHGSMQYLKENSEKRLDPIKLLPNTKTIICCALNYFTNCNSKTLIARYALGRDYHKVMKKRLEQLAKKIAILHDSFNYRVFCDSAPVLEKILAVKAGLGWQGKNSLLINKNYGSWLVLGEIFTDLDLTLDKPQPNRCGKCTACLDACPTKAITAPYKIDARRCLAYLTVEKNLDFNLCGSDRMRWNNEKFKTAYGCDICQLACPWNRFAKVTKEQDFATRHNLDELSPQELANWSKNEFSQKTVGSTIRRI